MMQIQNSYDHEQKGKLYVVATPIGNLDDMTYRAVQILQSVELIAAEDTRRTQKLLQHFEIKNRLLSYNDHNLKERIPRLLTLIAEGKEIALVSDAGMPAISDPGYELVEAAVAENYPVITIPGANAAISALVASGLPTNQFLFIGFLPRKKSEKKAALSDLKYNRATMIFYESPNRIENTLALMEEHFGNRKVVIARELTKIYEQFIRGTIEEVYRYVKENPLKGECVIIVEGNERLRDDDEDWWEDLTMKAHVNYYEEKGYNHKEALKLVAQDRGVTKREVYNDIHVKKNE